MWKTILWIYNHPLNAEAGGTERITSLIMRGLSANGHRCMGIMVVDVQLQKLTYEDKDINDLYSFLKQNGVDTVINQSGHTVDLLKYFLDRGGEKWHSEGGKIVSCLHFHPKPIGVCYQFQSKKSKSWHDYYVIGKTWLLRNYLARKDNERIGRIYREIYDMSDVYVVLSAKYLGYMIATMRLEENTKLVAIANPLTFETISDKSILESKRNTILVVSRLMDWQKRVMLSIKVWEKLSKQSSMQNWNLRIVGSGEDYDYYRRYIETRHIDRISLEGQQSPERYYSDAKIFLMTSKTEGWGLTLTESLQRGVVPVAFNTSEPFSDIIRDGYNGFLIKEGDMRTYAKKIKLLARNHALWRKMAGNALDSACKFTLAETIKEWEKII